VLSDEIFSRLAGIPLVDRYGAYQLLDDEWGRIAVDLEIIQTEGFAATKQVDPNMVSKKKDGKDQEVQDGWVGHVIPFALVQESMMSDDLAALTQLENRLSEITGEYESLLDELGEEDKEMPFVNEGKDAFVPAEVKKALKAKEVEAQTLAVLKKADALINEEKALRRQIKTDSTALHTRTKATIEGLSDDEVMELLRKKWILPITNSLHSLPGALISDFIGKLEGICKKYETTFAEVEAEIADTERSLIAQLDDLRGSEFDMMGLSEFKKLLGGE
jgi:type I restriction enzyme M protein